MLPLFAIIFFIFYFLVIRPQSKEKKKREALLKAAKKGDKIVTTAGIHGKIVSTDDATVLVEVDDGVRLRFDRAAVWQVKAREGEAAERRRRHRGGRRRSRDRARAPPSADSRPTPLGVRRERGARRGAARPDARRSCWPASSLDAKPVDGHAAGDAAGIASAAVGGAQRLLAGRTRRLARRAARPPRIPRFRPPTTRARRRHPIAAARPRPRPATRRPTCEAARRF